MVREGWIRMPLGKFVSLQRGHDLPDERRQPGKVPILGSFGITGWHDTAMARGPGVTVGRSGASFGVVSFSPRDYWPLNTALYVTDFHGNDERFAYYFLKHFDFRSFNSGSAQPSLNRNFVHPVLTDVPTVPVQRAIAHILGTLDDKIELNRKMNETLEQMARAIFKSWFVDFEPFRDKGMVDSPLGKIPKGWKVKPLPEAIEVNPPRALKKGVFALYLDMQNMPERGHRPKAWIEREYGSGMRFQNGDTLVARITPCLENGKTAFVDFLGEERVGWGSTEFIVLRPKPPLPAYYGYLLARSDELRSHAIQNMTGSSGRQRVPPECLSQFDVVVPEEPVAEAFGKRVQPIAERIRSNSEQSATLAAVRDALLPKLMSGEIALV